MMVLFIFVDFTMPDKIRPRIEMLPVNGHFLSTYVPANAVLLLPTADVESGETAHDGSSVHDC